MKILNYNTKEILPVMMTNKKIVVRHLHKYTKKNIFPHTVEKSTEGNNYCERLLLFDISSLFSHDEMMRSIFHKYKALQKNIDTKLI